MSKYGWEKEPEQGGKGWLVMGYGTITVYQQPDLGVLLTRCRDEEGACHWKIIGSELDGALYPTADVAMAAVNIVLGKEEDE